MMQTVEFFNKVRQKIIQLDPDGSKVMGTRQVIQLLSDVLAEMITNVAIEVPQTQEIETNAVKESEETNK